MKKRFRAFKLKAEEAVGPATGGKVLADNWIYSDQHRQSIPDIQVFETEEDAEDFVLSQTTGDWVVLPYYSTWP